MAGQLGPEPFPKFGDIVFKQASFAESRAGHFGRDYYVARGAFGKGLFTNRAFHKGEVIAPYDGEMIVSEKDRPTTHMLRLKDTGLIIDGQALSKNLKWEKKSKKQWPDEVELYSQGYASISNSSAGSVSNAVMILLRDDRTYRSATQNPELQEKLKPTITRHMNLRAQLVATRDIPNDTEVLWYQNPKMSPSGEIIDMTV